MVESGVELERSEGIRLPAAPWLSIWVFPKRTIRFIVDSDPKMWVVPLAVFTGIANLLDAAIGGSWGDTLPLFTILAIVVVAGPIVGWVGLYLGGALLRWSGSLLGGKASAEEVRAAIAWSSIPSIVSGLLAIPLVLVLGSEAFTTEAPRFEVLVQATPALGLVLGLVLLGVGFGGIVLGIWRFVLSMGCLAEVHGFSAWKALIATLIPGVILVVPVVCLALAIVGSSGP